MNETRNTYQAMLLLDNEQVRQGFDQARDWVKATLEKHGFDVRVLRLWGERPLSYRIKGKGRATYLLAWLEGSSQSVNDARREFYLVGPVFRCLFLVEDSIPEEELAYGIEEVDASQLVIPEDEPEQDEEEYAEEESASEGGAEKSGSGGDASPAKEGKEDDKGSEKEDDSKSSGKQPAGVGAREQKEEKSDGE